MDIFRKLAGYMVIIFDKFTKAKRKGIQGEKTVGLGLHIIKHLVDLHKGKIWFTSEENKDTSFYIEFPKARY